MRKLLRTIVSLLIVLNAQVTLAEQISIESRVANESWKTKLALEPLRGQPVFLRVKRMKGTTIRWFEIVPKIDIRYNNAVWPWLPSAYEWKGFDEIEYRRIHLHQFDGKWQIQLLPKEGRQAAEQSLPRSDSLLSYLIRRLFGSRSRGGSFHRETLGSFWYQVEITRGKQRYRTPGIESKDKRGLSPQVFRVSVKEGNDLLGNLTSYFNVPAVFGSTPYQVRNYIGIDCADVLMAAYCKSKALPITRDYNVAMLISKFPPRVKSRVRNGHPGSNIRWGKDVKEGDFIAVKYRGARQYQHIGALYEDQNGNGSLDEKDLVLHAGPDPLHFSELRSGKFDGRVAILRPI